MDPITTEDELKRSNRVKQYQQYQTYLDALDSEGVDDPEEASQTGTMGGKTFKKISGENSPIGHLFANTFC